MQKPIIFKFYNPDGKHDLRADKKACSKAATPWKTVYLPALCSPPAHFHSTSCIPKVCECLSLTNFLKAPISCRLLTIHIRTVYCAPIFNHVPTVPEWFVGYVILLHSMDLAFFARLSRRSSKIGKLNSRIGSYGTKPDLPKKGNCLFLKSICT